MIFAGLLVAGLCGAQSAEAPKFEVASVKPSDGQRAISFRLMPGGRVVANAPVKLLLMNAYAFQRSQIAGGPDWINTDFYEVEAKAGREAPRGQIMAMLQDLLAERFGIKLHREIREAPVYALTVSKNGPKLSRPSQSECPAESNPASPSCGQMRIVPSASRIRMVGDRVPMAELLRVLAVVCNQPVLDRTNLSGLFDIRLHFVDEAPGSPPSDSPEPTLFLALQEQLGLRLESSKGRVEFLVIDRIERPSAN